MSRRQLGALLDPRERRLSPGDESRQAATERPFSGKFERVWADGSYHCICCGNKLFDSDTKFDAGCGWPSYFEPVSPESVTEHRDSTYGMVRTEIRCGACEAHLGHVFPDGPPPTGLRYCMNGVAMKFEPEPEPKDESSSA